MTDAIVLCADDYALTAPVSRAILSLASAGRISALSCMTASPYWPEHGPWLASVKDKVDIGLHLTLVDEAPLTAMPRTAPNGRLPGIGALIVKSYLGRLDEAEIAGEIDAQIAAFIRVMGRPPAHIDGHLHAHVLPGIRALVVKAASALEPKPWLRNVHDPLSRILRRHIAVPKAAFIARLGAPFARAARALGLPVNDGFSGVYDFAAAPNYAALFPQFLEPRQGKHVILCHPGEAGDDSAWAAQRGAEYAFLSGPVLPEILAAHHVRIGRFADA
jgi:predicted glycoside hydrolase/deacetylase ChbG (UPF0249 family)